MGSGINKGAFTRDADCSKRVVTGNHTTSEMCSAERLDSGGRSRLQLILENNETKKTQARLGLFSIIQNQRTAL
jgi:hypothetical protein